MEERDKRNSGQVYAELLCDFMFKRLFGSEAYKDVLISFLNMLLKDDVIEDVTFIPTEHFGLTEEDRKVIFDIMCSCSNGKRFIIEMQNASQKHFRKRALFYTAYPINEQGRMAREEFIRDHESKSDGEKFKWDYDLKPIIVAAILNFMFEHDDGWPDDRYHSSYRLREDSTYEVMTDVLRFVFIELKRFNKRIWEIETTFDKWMYLLKHMHEMEAVPEKFDTPEFRRLFLLAKIGNFTPEEYKQYLKSLESMSDYYNIIDTAVEAAEKRALTKGREEGRAEGERIKAIEIASKLIANGMSKKEAAEFVGVLECDI